jgi:hypothetical protein
MPEQNGFFRWVWRINGLLLLLLLLGALAAIGCRIAWHTHAGMERFHTMFRPGHLTAGKETYSLVPLDGIGMLTGSPLPEKLYALSRNSDWPVDRHHPQHETITNILAVDEAAKSSHWLFKQGERAVLADDLLYDTASPKQGLVAEQDFVAKLSGIVMVVAENDTNKDGRYTAEDEQALYVYRFDGKPPEKLLSADTIVLARKVFNEKKYRFFYQAGGKTFDVAYSVPDFIPVSKIEISNLPKLADPPPVMKIGFTGIEQYVQ